MFIDAFSFGFVYKIIIAFVFVPIAACSDTSREINPVVVELCFLKLRQNVWRNMLEGMIFRSTLIEHLCSNVTVFVSYC